MTRCVILFSLVCLFVAILAPAAQAFRFSNRGKSIFGRGGVGGQSPKRSRIEQLTPAQAAQIPTRQQVDAFLDRNPAAKSRVARSQARAASARPVRFGSSCDCSSSTCNDESFTMIGVFDTETDGAPCYIMDPQPYIHQCTEATEDMACPDILGCGCTMGSCTSLGEQTVTFPTVCYVGGSDIFTAFEDRDITIDFYVGGCCCELTP